ncbi:MAG: hypothetical protein COS94_03475 [Candidatus Hydrogenedentes bacterium CG07_land_8_20_14_0_80_42_17]|nr:MAG: hypothetical protein COS94_03475 [Candidatus Hydrogenedentes bacterium CG07_land_8_20_14_0_80_42_17]
MKDSVDKLIFEIIAGAITLTLAVSLFATFYLGKINTNFLFGKNVSSKTNEAEISEMDSSNPEINIALRNKDWAEAEKLIEKKYGFPPKESNTAHILGLVIYNHALQIYSNNPSNSASLSSAVTRLETARALLISDNEAQKNITRALAGIGLTAYQNGSKVDGRKWAEEANRILNQEPYVNYVLGSIAVGEGRYIDAVPLLKISLNGEDKDIRASASALLSKIESDAKREEGFSTYSSSQFTIRFEGNPQPALSSRIIGILERQRSRVQEVIGHAPTRTIEVIVYTSPSFAVQRGLPDWVGALFDGRIRLSAVEVTESNDERLNKILGHELTHATIYDKLGRPGPAWLEEGLAQLITEGNSYSKTTLNNKIQSRNISLQSLGGNFTKMPQADAEAAYALSYATVLYLSHSHGGNIHIQILNELAEKKSIEEILIRVAGFGQQELGSKTKDWLTQ